MKNQNLVMKVAVAGALLVAGVAANAAAVTSGLSSASIAYSKEITTTGGVVLGNTADVQGFTVLTDTVVAAGASYYVALTLSNGATWPTSGITATGTANCVAGTPFVNGSTLSFEITGANTGCTIGNADGTITVALPAGATKGVSVVNSNTVNMDYSLYPASGPSGTPLQDFGSAKYITFATGIAAADVSQTVTSSYAAAAGVFTNEDPAVATLSLGSTSVNAQTATTVYDATGVALAAASTEYASGVLTISGDFSAAFNAKSGKYVPADVTLVTGTCAVPGVSTAATSLTQSTATFATLPASDAAQTLCYALDAGTANTIVLPVSTYTSSYALTAATGYTLPAAIADSANDMGKVAHNGSTLQAPLAQITSGYVSRFVLNNSSATDVPVSITTAGETGNTLTPGSMVSATIPANSMLVIPATSVVSATSAAPRFSTTFSVAATAGTVTGAYEIVDPSGAVSITALTAP